MMVQTAKYENNAHKLFCVFAGEHAGFYPWATHCTQQVQIISEIALAIVFFNISKEKFTRGSVFEPFKTLENLVLVLILSSWAAQKIQNMELIFEYVESHKVFNPSRRNFFTFSSKNASIVKFMLSKKATKIDEIFTVALMSTT